MFDNFNIIKFNKMDFDKKHIWHPYTSMTNPLPVYKEVSANGVRLKLENGNELIDGMSSWWAAIHGYNNPVLNNAITKQLKNMSHVMFGGITHEPAIALAKLLIEITPKDLQKVFYSDSGSVAVEIAIKMAIQYWHSKKRYSKNKLLTIRSGYHGDTFYAMSVCDPETGMHNVFNNVVPINYFAESPKCKFNDVWDSKDLESIKSIIEKENKNIAAVILEPIVQGAGGMKFYSPQYLIELKKLCVKHDLLLIFDEIATGFGRTGKLFAMEHADVVPDILCLGKAITGGYMSFAATLTSTNVAEVISNGESKVFMHGPTFMGNPLACSLAAASINLLLSTNWKEKVLIIENQLKQGLEKCKTLQKVADVRCLGAIGVVELKKSVNLEEIQKNFVEHGVWIRPFGKLVYLMPPYIISEIDLHTLTNAIFDVLSD